MYSTKSYGKEIARAQNGDSPFGNRSISWSVAWSIIWTRITIIRFLLNPNGLINHIDCFFFFLIKIFLHHSVADLAFIEFVVISLFRTQFSLYNIMFLTFFDFIGEGAHGIKDVRVFMAFFVVYTLG